MARQAATSVTNTFTKGLITEATGLNFPEDAVTDTDNCVFERIGDVTRRLGIELEDGFEVDTTHALTNGAITEFLWKSAALNGELTFLVIQVGRNILFYRLNASGALSANLQTFTVDLEDFATSGAPSTEDINCSFASGNGVLFVTHPYCEPFYVQYDPVSNSTSTHSINVQIRDMRGLDQSGTVANYNDRVPVGSITDTIKYNLCNQGWGAMTRYANASALINFNLEQQVFNNSLGVTPVGTFTFDPIPAIDAWFGDGAPLTPGANGGTYTRNAHTNVWPSEAEAWWLFKYAGGVFDFFDTSAGTEKFPLNAPCAKGHYIYNAFNINRAATCFAELSSEFSQVIGVLTLPLESSGYFRPSQVAFFSGRAFYAGVPAQGFSQKVYFTKVIEQPVDYGKCHQVLDPTGEQGGDLVASDGGVLVIPDVAQIIKLFPTGHNLFIFATNGIWKVSGSLGNTGFAANAYAISRISTINAQSALNFVDVDGMPVWWNNDGIWTLKSDQLGTSVSVESITLSTISTFVEDILPESKRYVKGAFNPFSRIVQWIYRSTEADAFEENFQYDRILNLDTLTKAFYPWSLPIDAQSRIAGIFVPQGTISEDAFVSIFTSGGDSITNSGGDNVVVNRPQQLALSSVFKYLVITPSA